MAALPALITVEQFQQMKDDGRAYELHDGEVVCVTRPKPRHFKIQHRLVRLLQERLSAFGEAAMEYPYRPLAEFDLRAAHVAVVSRARWDAEDPDVNLLGSPELVIEVKSPSNIDRELRKLASLCLLHGALEFWIVEPIERSVTVLRRDGTTTVYRCGDNIPLPLFRGDSLSVDEVFDAK